MKRKITALFSFFAVIAVTFSLIKFFDSVRMPVSKNISVLSIIRDIKKIDIEGYGVFNGGVLSLDDGYLFASRRAGKNYFTYKVDKFKKKNISELLIGELDKNFQCKDSTRTVFRPKDRNWLYIDARLLKVGDEIYMVYCRQYKIYKEKLEANLYLSKLIKRDGRWEPVSDIKLQYKGAKEFYENGTVTKNFEKNWMPFSSNGKLYFVYLMEPEHLILQADLKSGICSKISSTKNNFPKDLAQQRGSTPAVFDDELKEWITLYHYVLFSNRGLRKIKKYPVYYVGGYTFSEEMPFTMLRKSQGMLDGEEFYNARKIVFPMALVRDGNDYLMFYGEDDRINKVARIDRDELIASMVQLKDLK